jgi:hypothetical protein
MRRSGISSGDAEKTGAGLARDFRKPHVTSLPGIRKRVWLYRYSHGLSIATGDGALDIEVVRALNAAGGC